MAGDNDRPLIERGTPKVLWQVVVSMNEAGGVHVAQHCPSPDVAAMLLARALMFLEREMLLQRLRQTEPRLISPGGPLPPRRLEIP